MLPASVKGALALRLAALLAALYAAADLNRKFAVVTPNELKVVLPIFQPSATLLAPRTMRKVLLASSTCSAVAAAVVRDEVTPSTTKVPSVWLNQLLKFVPVMLATSALRVRLAVVVGM